MPPGTAREASRLCPQRRSYGAECWDGEFIVSLLPAFALAAGYRASRYAAGLLVGTARGSSQRCKFGEESVRQRIVGKSRGKGRSRSASDDR